MRTFDEVGSDFLSFRVVFIFDWRRKNKGDFMNLLQVKFVPGILVTFE